MARGVLIAILCSVAATVACGTQPKSRCERVCAHEHDCVQKLKRPGTSHDKDECIEQCQQLERDRDLLPFVEAHAKCVDDAVSCTEVLDCP
jgi:hypothetical protein